MAKLFTRQGLHIALLSILLLGAPPVLATKMARMSLADLANHSTLIAVVEIQSTAVSNKTLPLAHTQKPLSLVNHKAKILDMLKGGVAANDINFLDPHGLSAGKKYLVFLSKRDDGELMTDLLGYGALRIAYIPTKSGIVEAVRVPDSYIKLPASLKTEKGKTARDERATYIWVRFTDLVKILRR